MYKSREHFEYGNMHVAIDAFSGELLEIFSKRNYDNILKNAMYEVHQPFKITVKNGETVTNYFPVHGGVANLNPHMRVSISSEKVEGGLKVKVNFPYVSNGTEELPAEVGYSVVIMQNGLKFNLDVVNGFEGVITEVCFPVLPGVVLGDDYSDDTLVFPSNGGAKYERFVDKMSLPVKHTHWRWQEYRYNYILDGINTPWRLSEQGLKGVSGRYPGDLCMSWMDLYDGEGGVYFGVHNKDASHCCFLDAAGYGSEMPGVILGAATQPLVRQNQTYTTPDCIVALHEGDWHEGAKIYRSFRAPLLENIERRVPAWAKCGAGLFAHYDFKYQMGGVVHTYKDIPRLADEALAAGFNHILLSGWHLGGFDNGFPMYVPDPELGTEKEFIDGVAAAKAKGVHVTVYVNARLHNIKYNADRINEKVIVYDEQGHEKHSAFGFVRIEFADMCPNSEQWINEVFEFSKRITRVYGIEGIYFDVLSCGGGYCFNPLHSHGEIDSITPGELKMLKGVRADFEEKFSDTLMIMGEHVSDQVGGVMSFQLNQLWLTYVTAYPEMYRYTFPEHGLVDMIYPNKNQVFRAPLISKASQLFMARLFTNGSYFWVYDLVDDSTFTRDEEGFAILKDLIKLKKIQLSRAQNYLFRDTDGIISCSPCVMARMFESPDGKKLIAAFRLSEGVAKLKLSGKITAAEAVFADGSSAALRVDNCEDCENCENGASGKNGKNGKNGENGVVLTLPDNKEFLIFLS